MSKSIKFNVHDIFMEGQNTVENRNLFVSSPLFPSFVSLYNRAAGRVKVGLLKTRQSPEGENYISEVPIVNGLGFRVASLNNSNRKYDSLSFETMLSAFSKYGNTMLTTSNPKYIQSRLSAKSNHDAAARFDHTLSAINNAINSMIRNMVDSAIDKKFGKTITAVPMFFDGTFVSKSLITFLARYFVGEVTQSELSACMRNEFNSLFNTYCDNRSKFAAALADTRDMLSTEKWVYITNVNGGVVLGAIHSEPMCEALDRYTSEGKLPSELETYARESVPFKWYPSFDDIPEDYRKALTFSMVMLKAHTGSAEILPTEVGEKFYYELGAYCDIKDEAPSAYVLTK